MWAVTFPTFIAIYMKKGNKYLQIYMILKQPPGVLQEKVFLKILQYSQENTCARDSFPIQLQAPGLQLY